MLKIFKWAGLIVMLPIFVIVAVILKIGSIVVGDE